MDDSTAHMHPARAEEEALPQRVLRKRRRERPEVETNAAPAAELQQPAAAEVAAAEAPPIAAGEPPAEQAAAGATDATAGAAPAEPEQLQQTEPSNIHLPVYRTEALEGHKFEYLDHTADIQLHAWGETLEEAFENVALAMFNYMTPLKGIEAPEGSELRPYEAEGHDLPSLLFNFLDELLFTFSTEFFVCKAIKVTSLDREGFKIRAEGRGETFDRQRHVQGTEVKAITYSAMQINEKPGDAEVFVIVDI